MHLRGVMGGADTRHEIAESHELVSHSFGKEEELPGRYSVVFKKDVAPSPDEISVIASVPLPLQYERGTVLLSCACLCDLTKVLDNLDSETTGIGTQTSKWERGRRRSIWS